MLEKVSSPLALSIALFVISLILFAWGIANQELKIWKIEVKGDLNAIQRIGLALLGAFALVPAGLLWFRPADQMQEPIATPTPITVTRTVTIRPTPRIVYVTREHTIVVTPPPMEGSQEIPIESPPTADPNVPVFSTSGSPVVIGGRRYKFPLLNFRSGVWIIILHGDGALDGGLSDFLSDSRTGISMDAKKTLVSLRRAADGSNCDLRLAAVNDGAGNAYATPLTPLLACFFYKSAQWDPRQQSFMIGS